ncbi:MAG: helix-turn-helix domain-containing protein [Planctomycetota bacterium]
MLKITRALKSSVWIPATWKTASAAAGVKELNGSQYCHECWDELANGVIVPLPEVLLYEENGKEFKRPKSNVTYDDILARLGERQGKYVVHIADLCREHDIDVKHRTRGGIAFRAHRYIKIPPIKSEITYATALHEIGHIIGNMQDGDRLEHEVGAWEWAKDNAIAWSERMEKDMRKCLNTYVREARHTGRSDVQRGLQLSEMLVAEGFREPYVPRNRGDQRLRVLRKAAGWTHAELARRIGCDKRAVMEWERQSVRSAFRDDFFGGILREWYRQALAAFGLTAAEFLWFAPVRPKNGSPREAYITARNKALAKARQAIRDQEAARRRESKVNAIWARLTENKNPFDEAMEDSWYYATVDMMRSCVRQVRWIKGMDEYDLLRYCQSTRARWLPAETLAREWLGEEPSPLEAALRLGMRRARRRVTVKGGSSRRGVLATVVTGTPQPDQPAVAVQPLSVSATPSIATAVAEGATAA